MLGPSYGKWWNEQPRYARLRYGLIVLPFVLILSWVLYQYATGVYLRADIFDAVERGNLGDIRALILDGAPADARQNNGTSLLHQALEMNHFNVVPLLIKEGADVNAVDHRGITPIHLAAGKGNTALHKAARQGNHDLLILLIEHNADVNVSTQGLHVTPLHKAVRYGHEKIVRVLLNSGANVNAYSNLYGTPLHWAAEKGHRGIVEALLEYGASTNTLDSHQLTPADRAREKGQIDLVALLDTVNESGKSGTPDLSLSSGNHKMDEECVFPKRMQSTSRIVLGDFIDDQISTAEFLRQFSLTNSRYLALGNCLVNLLEKD
jgi:ankyrin repeat protein